MRLFAIAIALVASSAAVAQGPAAPAQPAAVQGPRAPQDGNQQGQQAGKPAPDGGATAAPGTPPGSVQDFAAHFDEVWMRRDQKGAEKELYLILKPELTSNPESFEANWRLASLLNWQANSTEGDLKASLGKGAWNAGDKAILARPDDVRGHYQAGTGSGLYAEGVGILTALSQGLEGKFRDRLQAALRINKDYLDGAPQVVWGRYFYKLPWPKRDVGESLKVLREAVKTHPNNWRAKIYLADSLVEEGKTEEGRKLVQEVLDAKGGEDPPEEKRMKDLARQWMSGH